MTPHIVRESCQNLVVKISLSFLLSHENKDIQCCELYNCSMV